LQLWATAVGQGDDAGSIKKLSDNDIQSVVYEIAGANVAKTYMTCPADPTKELGIKLRTRRRPPGSAEGRPSRTAS